MRFGLLNVSVLACALGLHGAVSAAACGPFRSLHGGETEGCECGEILERLDLSSPISGLAPSGVCDYRLVEYESGLSQAFGQFYFKGEITEQGRLRFFSNEVLADTLEFRGRSVGSVESLGVHWVRFRFAEQDAVIREFSIPSLDPSGGCVEADATVVVTELVVLPGGTDESGSYATRYTVKSVSGLGACDAES